MAKITYLDKVALNENTDIPDNNKVKANDMNEIKTVVNTNDDTVQGIINGEKYSTTEVKTNKVWINNKPIYRTCLNVGTISTTGNTTIDHNIQNISEYTSITARGKSGSSYYNIPFASNQGMFSGKTFSLRAISPTQVQIYTGATGHSFIIILEYTKTTD